MLSLEFCNLKSQDSVTDNMTYYNCYWEKKRLTDESLKHHLFLTSSGRSKYGH